MKAEHRLQLLRQDMDHIQEALESMESNAIRFYQETNQHEMVKAFHKKFGRALPDAPTFDFPVDLRLNLIEEELDELKQAIVDENMPEFVDAIVDLLYVVHGLALAAGIQHIQPFYEEVHRCNMQKVPYTEKAAVECRAAGKKVPIGKTLKPEGWEPPRIAELLAEHYSEAV